MYVKNKMGIFNEHSSGQQFARGLQGAPGVGFNLTADGNYDMANKKLTNVGAPASNTDAATKKYVDDNSSGGKTSSLTVDSNIDMKDSFHILNLKSPSDAKEAATKNYTDSNFFYINGSKPMTGNLNMNNNRIYNIPNPNGPKQPTPLAYTDLAYLHVDRSNKMTNHLNMNNKKITYLQATTSNSDAATKLYVDNKSTSQDLSPYLKKDGSDPMTGSLNMGGHKITNLKSPTSDTNAATKLYIDSQVNTAQVKPSHYTDKFSYLMSSPNQWTDEITEGDSFYITKIADLPTIKGNFHKYNHKALYLKIVTNSQGSFKYKMGINFYRLPKNVDYTICLEILNTNYELWHKSQISVDRGTSQGLAIENVSVKKLSHRYTDVSGRTQFMYYHTIIVNFKKLISGNPFFLHILVNIPNVGNDLAIYPKNFTGVYMIAYGIVSKVSNIDPDKVYDYHSI